MRNSIISAFQNPKELFCQIGLFLEGNSQNGPGTHVIFWGHGKCRQITQYLDGYRNGVLIRVKRHLELTPGRHELLTPL